MAILALPDAWLGPKMHRSFLLATSSDAASWAITRDMYRNGIWPYTELVCAKSRSRPLAPQEYKSAALEPSAKLTSKGTAKLQHRVNAVLDLIRHRLIHEASILM